MNKKFNKGLFFAIAIILLSIAPHKADAFKKCFFSGKLCINIKISVTVDASVTGTASRSAAQLDKLASQIEAVAGKDKGSIVFIMPKELAGYKVEITENASGKQLSEFGNKNLIVKKTSFVTPSVGRPEVSVPVMYN